MTGAKHACTGPHRGIDEALEIWKVVTVDKSGFLDRMVGLLGEHWIRYCVVGGMQ